MEHLKRERDAIWVPRSRILVDPSRNLVRGGRPIDPNSPLTIELAIDIGERGQLEPIRVRELSRQEKQGKRDLRVVAGYRRIAAMDLLHQNESYRVHVIPTNATSDVEELAENCAENFGHVPPNDWDMAEGLSLFRQKHNLSLDLLMERLFSRANNNALLGRARVRKAITAWEGLIQPLREVWKRNTSLFQLEDAFRSARLDPNAQEQVLQRLVHMADDRKTRAELGLPPPAGPVEMDETSSSAAPKRPSILQVHRAYGWVRANARDTHDDGLNRETRPIVRAMFRWFLGIPSENGKLPVCPVKPRKTQQIQVHKLTTEEP